MTGVLYKDLCVGTVLFQSKFFPVVITIPGESIYANVTHPWAKNK